MKDLYENHLDRGIKFLSEEIPSKEYVIKTLLEFVFEISNFFHKNSYNENFKQNVNAEIQTTLFFKNKKEQTSQYCKLFQSIKWKYALS